MLELRFSCWSRGTKVGFLENSLYVMYVYELFNKKSRVVLKTIL